MGEQRLTQALTQSNRTALKTADSNRDNIFRLEKYIKENMEPAQIGWIHRFAPGVYSREMIVPEGVIVTGAIHKTEHISIFLEGSMLVPDGQGGNMVIHAPLTEICQPGAKRVGVALTECRWITFHPTELRDVEACEEAFFTNDPAEVPEHESQALITEQVDYALEQRGLLPAPKGQTLASIEYTEET